MSTDWKIFEGDDRNWDELLKHIGQMCVYQSANWARHKSSAGWIPIRVVKSTATSHIAIQCLVRRGPFGVAMAWAPGGFGGDLALLTKDFSSALKKLLSARFLYIRFGMMIDSTQEQIPLLVGAGFKKSRTSIGGNIATGAIFTMPAFFIAGIWNPFYSTQNYLVSTIILVVGGILFVH